MDGIQVKDDSGMEYRKEDWPKFYEEEDDDDDEERVKSINIEITRICDGLHDVSSQKIQSGHLLKHNESINITPIFGETERCFKKSLMQVYGGINHMLSKRLRTALNQDVLFFICNEHDNSHNILVCKCFHVQ